MCHAFISYCHKDSEFAHQLADELESREFSVWIDRNIEYGSNWTKEIQESLDSCGAFIVVMTPNSFASDWVQKELARALHKRKQVFPILLEGEIWLSVQTIQLVDVRADASLPDGFYIALAKFVPPQLEPSEEMPNELVLCFGVNTFELLESGILPPHVPTNYPHLCDWLESDLAERLTNAFGIYEYPEASGRSGETLSVRITVKSTQVPTNLHILDFGWWDLLELQSFQDIYDEEP